MLFRREDWMLATSAMQLVERTVVRGALLRHGSHDDLRVVLVPDQRSNLVGRLVALSLEQLAPAVPELILLIPASYYTDHRDRAGAWRGLVGSLMRYELGGP